MVPRVHPTQGGTLNPGPAPAQPNGILIIGMHRSGTSATTRVLNLMGAATAHATDLVPPTDSNPKGHWESRTLRNFNDIVLGRLKAGEFRSVTFGAGEAAREDDVEDAHQNLRDRYSSPPSIL